MKADYIILKVHNNPVQPDGGIEALERKVAELVAAGWQPQGGPFYEPGQMRWCQAMVKPISQTAPGEVPLRGLGYQPIANDAGGSGGPLREPGKKRL